MSREIEFRAWGPNSKTMWNWEQVKGIASNLGWEDFNEGERVLMQYTGLKDKNGVKIFEGDLIKNDRGRTGKVVWHELSASFDTEWVSDSEFNPAIDASFGFKNSLWKNHVEVIGNIYELANA